MRLLFDANLSRRLIGTLAAEFPQSAHASAIGANPGDDEIWRHAKTHDLVIVSKDSDFYRMSMVWGAPPKVIWLRVGNAGTAAVAALLKSRNKDIETFVTDPTTSLLIVGGP